MLSSVFVLLLVLFAIGVLVTWIVLSRSSYTEVELFPGMTYAVRGQRYTFPGDIQIDGNAFLLKDYIIEEERELYTRTRDALNSLGIESWVTGGTLLGVERHGTLPMHTDDDIDIAVDDEHREKLYSQEFVDACELHGLDTLYLMTNTPKKADVHGSAARVQVKGKNNVTCDIFFWKKCKDGKVRKLDGWHNNTNDVSERECFDHDDVFPIKRGHVVDGMVVDLPHNPKALLEQQYGKDVMNRAVCRPLLISHAFPFALWFIWRRTPPAATK